MLFRRSLRFVRGAKRYERNPGKWNSIIAERVSPWETNLDPREGSTLVCSDYRCVSPRSDFPCKPLANLLVRERSTTRIFPAENMQRLGRLIIRRLLILSSITKVYALWLSRGLVPIKILQISPFSYEYVICSLDVFSDISSIFYRFINCFIDFWLLAKDTLAESGREKERERRDRREKLLAFDLL